MAQYPALQQHALRWEGEMLIQHSAEGGHQARSSLGEQPGRPSSKERWGGRDQPYAQSACV